MIRSIISRGRRGIILTALDGDDASRGSEGE